MPLYRKRPVVIEARRLDSLNYVDDFDLVDWCGGRAVNGGIVIPTLEGEMMASFGDWIIKGVGGEFYPCKPAIFTASYEPA